MIEITLKLYATLTPYLPDNAVKNEVKVTYPEGTSVLDVLLSRNVPMDTCHLVLVNGVFSPPAFASKKILADGDALAVWPPIAGG